MAERRNFDVRLVHAGNPERVDGAESVQDVPVEFDAMPGRRLCERIGYRV